MTLRPSVAVIVPFAGPPEQLRDCVAALGRLNVAPGDELIVADNRGRPGTGRLSGAVRVVAAAGVRAAGFARNRGAEAATAEWLAFLDADTRPSADLLERYFDPAPAPGTALLAGGIVDVAGGDSAAARRSARRGQMSQRWGRCSSSWPAMGPARRTDAAFEPPTEDGVTEPTVSVVVATHDRPRRLARLLRTLAGQTLGPDRFEVIVVDDGSGPETAAVLAAAARTVAVRHPNALGPAAARNTGWRRARAPLVAFTDDDCTPHPGWLEALLAASTAHPGALVQGITRPDPTELDRRGLLSHTVLIEGLGPQYQTCNIAYPRSLLADLGGFDERFGPGSAGEDTDLAWRAIESGRSTVLAPDAVVDHAVELTGVLGSLRLAARWASAVRVLGEHPATRVMLHRGLFWNVWHYLMWRSLLAILAPVWLRRLVLARHLAQLRRRAAERGAGAVAVPFLLVHDAVECAAVAAGALRHRVRVL